MSKPWSKAWWDEVARGVADQVSGARILIRELHRPSPGWWLELRAPAGQYLDVEKYGGSLFLSPYSQCTLEPLTLELPAENVTRWAVNSIITYCWRWLASLESA